MKLDNRIFNVKIEEIKPAEYNPRQANEKQYNDLKGSIKKFGLVDPLIVNKRNHRLIGGHFRLRVAKDLGFKKVPVVFLDLDAKAEKELNLRLNKNLGDWDWDKLVNWEKDLLIDVGFEDKELNKYFQLDIEEDDFDTTPPKKAESKLGEVYILGNHRLMCGDSTKKEDVEKLMDGDKADMVFTDPPYNVDYEGMQNSKQWDKIANDAMPKEEFEEMLYMAFSNINLVSKGGAALYICHADKSHVEFRKAFEKAGYGWRATIIWSKNSPAFNFAQYKYKHEPIFYCFKEGETVAWYGDRTQHTIWEVDKERGDHPTIKPVTLISKAIKNSSKTDDIVLDLFGGSGSTLIAAEQTNRVCYMMELDPKYCDVIRNRYNKYKER